MTPVDWIIVAFIALSVVIGLVRGLIVEVLSLVIWAAAVLLAMRYGEALGQWFEASIALPSVRLALGYTLIFLGTTVLGGIVLWLLRRLIAGTGLSGTDRLMGACFGLLRGALLLAVVLTVARLTPLTRDDWWQKSSTIPAFVALGASMIEALPAPYQHIIDGWIAQPEAATEGASESANGGTETPEANQNASKL